MNAKKKTWPLRDSRPAGGCFGGGGGAVPEVQRGVRRGKPGSTEEAQLAAPDFTVLDSEGNEVQLSDYVGKPIVLNFWATWCYYCKEEMPDFDKAYEAYPEVQFLMVNATDGVQETMESAQEYIQQEGFQFDVFYDTQLEAVNAYYVTGFPATYFIDAQGNLVTRSRGMLDYDTLVKGIGMITE